MREFIKEMQEEPRQNARRFVVESTVSSSLAPVAAVLGLATLLGEGPVTETMRLMGLPRWSYPLLGVLEVAAATLVLPVAAFLGAVVGAALGVIGALMYLPLGERGFAVTLAVGAAIWDATHDRALGRPA
ncbi:MAG: hypothetical protein FJ137_03840 [Deltaproteobacteria bacterium]|nr:hypothetical protein [Deltaproteobacteria bacterium]